MSQRKRCFFFNTPAGCRKGADCKWRHEGANTASPASAHTPGASSNNPRSLDIPKGACRFFWNNGSCRFANCRFNHVRQEGDSASRQSPPVQSSSSDWEISPLDFEDITTTPSGPTTTSSDRPNDTDQPAASPLADKKVSLTALAQGLPGHWLPDNLVERLFSGPCPAIPIIIANHFDLAVVGCHSWADVKFIFQDYDLEVIDVMVIELFYHRMVKLTASASPEMPTWMTSDDIDIIKSAGGTCGDFHVLSLAYRRGLEWDEFNALLPSKLSENVKQFVKTSYHVAYQKKFSH
jgi:hypothetical protein